MKRRYDITFTIELSEKQRAKLDDACDMAERLDEPLPEWNAGLAATTFLRDAYGVRAKLIGWEFRRNMAGGGRDGH